MGISAYFSHSYWPEDTEINKHFWKLFWEAGFTFTVAPRSHAISIPQVELLIRRNACFVAVVTHRPQEPDYLASPYVVFEYGLAVQAAKPRLVFVDRRAARDHYEETWRVLFDRDAIADDRDRHAAAIRRLSDLGAAHAQPGEQRRRSVGLVLPRDTYGRAMPDIRKVLRRWGYEPVVIDCQAPNPYRCVMDVERHDFVVIDVGSDRLPSWLHPVLHGRSVPMVRLLRRGAGGRPTTSPRGLGLGHAIESVARSDQLVIWWTGIDELVAKLDREVRVLAQPPPGALRTHEAGLAYFNSLGRSVDATVFVSSADSENDVAEELCRDLEINRVRFFRSVFEDSTVPARLGGDGLRDRLRSSQLFVPLLTPAYWESDARREEFRIAEELAQTRRLRILPYVLEPGGPPLSFPGRPLYRLPAGQWLDRIMTDVDGYLAPRSVATEASCRWWQDEAEPQVDVAFVAVRREGYDAVLQQLDWTEPVPATDVRPNRHAWRFGAISPADGGRPYRVVVALAGEPGTSGRHLAVSNTSEGFRPRDVLLVGVACGLGAAPDGDVVVADRVCGYERVGLEGVLRPRPDRVCPTDRAIAGAANTIGTSTSTTGTRLLVGAVASGDAAVGDVGDAALHRLVELWPELYAVELDGFDAAEAIRDARERGHVFSVGVVLGRLERRAGTAAAAARAAAVFAVQMVSRAWPRQPRT
jgi:hypothetical protein